MRSRPPLLAALAAVVAVGTGCGGGTSPGAGTFEQTTTAATAPSEASTAASERSVVKVAYRDLCDASNDNKLIRTQGYLSLGSTTRRDGDPVTGEAYWHVELAKKPGDSGDVSVFLYEGAGKNQMQPVPEQYRPDDLKVNATNGQAVGPEDRVRIVGEANVGDGVCYIDPVQRIRKL